MFPASLLQWSVLPLPHSPRKDLVIINNWITSKILMSSTRLCNPILQLSSSCLLDPHCDHILPPLGFLHQFRVLKKQTWQWRLVCRKFIGECSRDECLWGREECRIGQRKKLAQSHWVVWNLDGPVEFSWVRDIPRMEVWPWLYNLLLAKDSFLKRLTAEDC